MLLQAPRQLRLLFNPLLPQALPMIKIDYRLQFKLKC
jgi:hypothetical protein